MRVPTPLADAFGASFEECLGQFAVEKQLISSTSELQSPRFVARSLVPHVQKLSDLFNRTERLTLEEDAPRPKVSAKERAKAQASGLEPYWKQSSNPANLRLAYFLYFMPPNLFRVAAIWAELARLGFQWPKGQALRGLELGAGPASGACGIAAGETFAPVGLPKVGNWALIEQDKAVLELGAEWAERYFGHLGIPDWGLRKFHRQIDFNKDLLPRSAPRFNLWLMSFFLNERTDSPETLAKSLWDSWSRHLDDEGIVILVEPALRAQSRRLLELRRALIALSQKEPGTGMPLQVLLPCLGHQACGALADPEDWCHEEVTWWRPPYLRKIDQFAGLDRKTLPFSYLVLARSKRSRAEILPALASGRFHQRLVSPAHSEGQDLEFFICGQDGKRRARFRPPAKDERLAELDRGDILQDAEIRGDANSARIESIRKTL